MPTNITIDADDVLHWSRHFDDLPKKIKPSIANSLNFIGGNVVDKAVQYMEATTGLDAHEIRNMIKVKEATPDDLNWEMDASAVAPPSLDWSRPWDKKDEAPFDDGSLVSIITMEDEIVCVKCQEAADDGPYTLTEAQAMLPVHPHCRCLVKPFNSTRRLPVTFGTGDASWTATMTPDELGKEVMSELHVILHTRDSNA